MYPSNMLDKFSKIVYSHGNADMEYLRIYHFFEKYDPTKTYTKDEFSDNFGYGNSRYKYELHCYDDGMYVVAKEILSDEMLDELKQYCQCEYHQKYFFNPARYFICQCCVGCLYAGNKYASQLVINKSRQVMKNAKS